MSQPFVPKGIDQSELDEVSKTYIVILKSDDNGLDSESIQDKHWDWVKERDNNGLDSGPEWDDVEKYEALGGYQAKLSEAAIKDLKERPEVAYVVQDRFGMLDMDDDPPVNINAADGAPWNLQRLSSTAPPDPNANPKALTYTYRRLIPRLAANRLAGKSLPGNPVHVYILDTGIITEHEEFQGRQVFQGPNYSADQENHHDTYGHGTHVAGTLAGNQCGVARDTGVHITAIKVATGSDSRLVRLIAVTRGLDWVLKQHRANYGIPTIVNMSLNFIPGDDALDDFVDKVVDQGVHVVVSAGNKKQDARTQSPARARGALAVGASTIEDKPYVKTNFGPKVAIFAPGVDIVSAGKDGPAERLLDSGTSMATPLVAGTIACLIQQEGNKSPEDMLKRLQELADESGRVVTGVPANTNTTTRLIWNGVR